MSELIFEKEIKGIAVQDYEEGIAFICGDMFQIRKKHNNAVIYSKPLVDYIKNRLLLPDNECSQKVYLQVCKDYFLIPINSYKFIQIPTKK